MDGNNSKVDAKRAQINYFGLLQITFSTSEHLTTQLFPTESMAVGKFTLYTLGEGAKPITEMSQQDQVIMEKHFPNR